VRNAIEAAAPDGWVRLTLEQLAGGQSVQINIDDSGPGPQASQRPLLFDPFFSGRLAGRGRGLGLPIAWRLARLQGGEVRLEAEQLNRPTRFVFTLPRALADQPFQDPPLWHPNNDAA
jgi:signal transduction histidine kinase